MKEDFALLRVFGIEIHEILARICKINLLLHHDGHTNIEGDRSCLDATFIKPRLQAWSGQFSRIIGNPPFGDEVKAGDDDSLGTNFLSAFEVAEGRDKVASEHAIVERCIDMLQPGGRFGLVLPDGMFNNQGEQSNCPRMRSFLAKNGLVEAIVSLPDFAFRKSGAQNKTSVLFYRRFSIQEKAEFDAALTDQIAQTEEAIATGGQPAQSAQAIENAAISRVYQQGRFQEMRVFFAETNLIGYTSTGAPTLQNELYRGAAGGQLDGNQDGTVLGEWQAFLAAPAAYAGRESPDCMAVPFADAWSAHSSHRLDPKYHLFKRSEGAHLPDGWVRRRLSTVMRRRLTPVLPGTYPNHRYKLITLSQTGEVRSRVPGKGNNPPDWLGMYLEDMPATWFLARSGDVIFSSIDLWKGCIALVPDDFDEAIVTKEFPIYEVAADDLDAEFLAVLLRSRYYQRAFRAITTGHSNRRRTQDGDFEALEICYPPEVNIQRELIIGIRDSRTALRAASNSIHQEMLIFSDLIDGRAAEELPGVDADEAAEV